MRTRAERRWFLARKQQRVRRRLRRWHWFGTDLEFEIAVRRRAVTPVPCSCPMCGHRRYWQGPSYQERRAALQEVA